ncbi:hypothetical protein [Pseudomonas salmasensis]|uniref:hypothetical protein n=1 Tax=Pseudomonas salmasensis TaxID=2745514 RepID=UPI001CECABB8|nr:hypothetical protein [Pseudomonas salmasensis]
MKLTQKQQSILDDLRMIGGENVYRYHGVTTHLHEHDRAKVAAGDSIASSALAALLIKLDTALKSALAQCSAHSRRYIERAW